MSELVARCSSQLCRSSPQVGDQDEEGASDDDLGSGEGGQRDTSASPTAAMPSTTMHLLVDDQQLLAQSEASECRSEGDPARL